MGCGQNMCRKISLGTITLFALSGLVIFLLGITFVGSYVGVTPTVGTGSSSNSIGPVGDVSVAPAPSPSVSPSDNPAPLAGFETVPIYLWFPILWGIFLMLVALLGCCGVKMYSRLMLGIYLILVLIIFFIQLALALVFTTLYQSDIQYLLEYGGSALKDEINSGAQTVTTVFFIVCALEIVVLISVGCFRQGLTGNEKEEKKEKKFQNLEDDISNRDAEREKRKNQFEMQSRKMADNLKKKTGGIFG